MANLIGMPRAAWRRPPSNQKEINTKHPLINKVFAIMYRDDVAVSTNQDSPPRAFRKISLVGTAKLKGTAYGEGIESIGDGNYAVPNSTFSPTDVVGTMLCAMIPYRFSEYNGIYGADDITTYSGYNLMLDQTTGTVNFMLGSGGSAGSTTRKTFTSASAVKLKSLSVFAIAVNSMTAIKMAIDGSIVQTTNSGTAASYATGSPTLVSIGRRMIGSSAYGYGAKNILLLAAWSREFNEGELISITENPWQLFKPRLARFISISSGPVTFQPAWARSRSLIIGSGV